MSTSSSSADTPTRPPSPKPYPQRGEKHFSHYFCRLMGKVCLGAEIGPEACWLLTYVVHTEDAAYYRRPVVFYNEDLATRTGLSLSAMKRARERAVNAGWLEYAEGAKRRPGRYFVLVPEWARGLDDAPGDEGAATPNARIPVQGEPESRRHADGKRTGSGRNADRLLPSPSPSPEDARPVTAEPSSGPTSDKSAEKKGRKSDPEADPLFAQFWAAYPRKVKKPAAAKAFARHAPDEALLGRMLVAIDRHKASAKWCSDDGQYIEYPATWLNNRSWEDEHTSAAMAKPEREMTPDRLKDFT